MKPQEVRIDEEQELLERRQRQRFLRLLGAAG